MSFIQILLIHIPTPLLGFLMVAIYVALFITGLIIIRKFYPHYKCKLHNDIAGFIFTTLGVNLCRPSCLYGHHYLAGFR